MDANRQKFWMLSEKSDFSFPDGSLKWDEAERTLTLASTASLGALPMDRSEARMLSGASPATIDSFGNWAEVDETSTSVLARGAFDDPVTIYQTQPGHRVLDLAMGMDGILYMVLGQIEGTSFVVMQDRRNRWDNARLEMEGFSPDCIVADSQNGAWALDRAGKKMARIRGAPLKKRFSIPYCPGTARPCEENPDPPELFVCEDVKFPADRELVAFAGSPDSTISILMWPPDRLGEAEVLQIRNGQMLETVQLSGSVAPFSIGYAGGHHWAILFKDVKEAVVYEISEGIKTKSKAPCGNRYPLVDWNGGRFVGSITDPVYYLSRTAPDIFAPRSLHRLSLPGYAATGDAVSSKIFDGGLHQTQWHRIYLEAVIPPGTGIQVFLFAADDKAAFLSDHDEMEHRFGSFPRVAQEDQVPKGAWVNAASEIPFHTGLANCSAKKDRAGLFTCLVQRSSGRTRTVTGRYLKIRIALSGNRQATPKVFAVRIYAPRFSYLDHYLPECYRETEDGCEDSLQNGTGAASGPDFMQRFLGLFESVLTPLEDMAAGAWMVTDPGSAPEDALDWLSNWISLTLEPGLSIPAKRKMLGQATRLFRKRGTLEGLSRILDIATNGDVSSGKIVILEDFRLRRILATIIGADLDDDENPLTLGISDSGNSYVGKTLFVGDEEQKELLALFRPSGDASENKQVIQFYSRLAHRVTLLVHQRITKEKFKLVRRIAKEQIPAHVRLRISTASKGLMLGMAALTGVDTRPNKEKERLPAKVGKSFIGRGDFILGAPSLDPRMEGGQGYLIPGYQEPTADAGPDDEAELGESFTLDGSGSRAYGGLRISRYIWTMTQ